MYWFDDEHAPTCRSVVEHARHISNADTSDPILLSPDGYVVDGMHRVVKAFIDGLTSIGAERLKEYPEPDRITDLAKTVLPVTQDHGWSWCQLPKTAGGRVPRPDLLPLVAHSD